MTNLFQEAPADLLKQLEGKLQSLLQQRNQLREELERMQKETGTHGTEIQQLREQVAGLASERDALAKERVETLAQVEAILQQLERLA